MFARPKSIPWKLLPVAVLFSLAVACDDDETTGPDVVQLVGTWNVTSLQAFGVDAIAQGMSMDVTLTAANTYTIVIDDDLLQMCATEDACTQTGSYSSTSTLLTLDPGLENEIILDYSINGSTMTASGNVNGTPVNMVMRRE